MRAFEQAAAEHLEKTGQDFKHLALSIDAAAADSYTYPEFIEKLLDCVALLLAIPDESCRYDQKRLVDGLRFIVQYSRTLEYRGSEWYGDASVQQLLKELTTVGASCLGIETDTGPLEPLEIEAQVDALAKSGASLGELEAVRAGKIISGRDLIRQLAVVDHPDACWNALRRFASGESGHLDPCLADSVAECLGPDGSVDSSSALFYSGAASVNGPKFLVFRGPARTLN